MYFKNLAKFHGFATSAIHLNGVPLCGATSAIHLNGVPSCGSTSAIHLNGVPSCEATSAIYLIGVPFTGPVEIHLSAIRSTLFQFFNKRHFAAVGEMRAFHAFAPNFMRQFFSFYLGIL